MTMKMILLLLRERILFIFERTLTSYSRPTNYLRMFLFWIIFFSFCENCEFQLKAVARVGGEPVASYNLVGNLQDNRFSILARVNSSDTCTSFMYVGYLRGWQ